MSVNSNLDLVKLLVDVKAFYKKIVVDFMIVSNNNKLILVQKRSTTRDRFPGLWEIPGGTLDKGESILTGIERQMYQETGMKLESVLTLAHKFDWGGSNSDTINLQFIVKGIGDYIPEKQQITDYKWINKDELDLILSDNEGDNQIYRGLVFAFGYLESYSSYSNSFESLDYKQFFSSLLKNFYEFIGRNDTIPDIYLNTLPEGYNIRYNKSTNSLEINVQLMINTNMNFASIIVLHDLYHNFKQGILSHADVVTIRDVFGQNEMLMFDIDADIELYRFMKQYYDFSFDKYLGTLWEGSTVFKNVVSRMPKVQRFMGSIMSIYLLYLGHKVVVFPNLTIIHNNLFLISLAVEGLVFHKLDVGTYDIDCVVKILQNVNSVTKENFINEINIFCTKFANPIIHQLN